MKAPSASIWESQGSFIGWPPGGTIGQRYRKPSSESRRVESRSECAESGGWPLGRPATSCAWLVLGRASVAGAALGGSRLGGTRLGRCALGRAALSGAALGGAGLGCTGLGRCALGRAGLGAAAFGRAGLGGGRPGRAALCRGRLGSSRLGGLRLGRLVRGRSLGSRVLDDGRVGRVAVGEPICSRQRANNLCQPGNAFSHERAGCFDRLLGDFALVRGGLDSAVSQVVTIRGHLGSVDELTLGGNNLLGQAALPRYRLVRDIPLPGYNLVGEPALPGNNVVGNLLRRGTDLGRAGQIVQRRQVRPDRLGDFGAGGLAALAGLLLALAKLRLPLVHGGQQLVLDFLREGAGVNHWILLLGSLCKLYQADRAICQAEA